MEASDETKTEQYKVGDELILSSPSSVITSRYLPR